MAWNYEKGCDEPRPYGGANHTGGIYTPPKWNPEALRHVYAWELSENNLKRSISRQDTGRQIRLYTDITIANWRRVEEGFMKWTDVETSADMRRGYLEYLAKENSAAIAMGFVDVDENSLPLLERIIFTGFRKLAKEMHPDTGGDAETFMKLRGAKEKLDALLRELEDIL